MQMSSDSFRAWFSENLGEYAADIAQHGCLGGFPKITYYKDTVALYDRFQEDIWEMLNEDAESFGHQHPLEFMATFNQASGAVDDGTLKNMLVWYACERMAYELEGVASEPSEDLDEKQPHIN